MFGLSYVEIFSPIYGEEKKEERVEEHPGKLAVIIMNTYREYMQVKQSCALLWDIDNNNAVKILSFRDMASYITNLGYKTWDESNWSDEDNPNSWYTWKYHYIKDEFKEEQEKIELEKENYKISSLTDEKKENMEV